MKNFFLAGAAALSLLAGCASGPTIRSHVDPSANLARYSASTTSAVMSSGASTCTQ
jgi:uncharacterized lipoprotein YajG